MTAVRFDHRLPFAWNVLLYEWMLQFQGFFFIFFYYFSPRSSHFVFFASFCCTDSLPCSFRFDSFLYIFIFSFPFQAIDAFYFDFFICTLFFCRLKAKKKNSLPVSLSFIFLFVSSLIHVVVVVFIFLLLPFVLYKFHEESTTKIQLCFIIARYARTPVNVNMNVKRVK